MSTCNNDVVQLFWRTEAKLAGCLGFTIDRQEEGSQWVPLPAWVGFQEQSNKPWTPDTTDVCPVQKFS